MDKYTQIQTITARQHNSYTSPTLPPYLYESKLDTIPKTNY